MFERVNKRWTHDEEGNRCLNFVLNGKSLCCKVIATGGTKSIIDLGDGNVIGVIRGFGNSISFGNIVDREINSSEKLRGLGLKVLDCKKIEIKFIDDEQSVPALLMPSFAYLAENGKQVRDHKNPDSSSGKTFIFGSKDNLKSIDYWRMIFSCIKDDLALCVINQLSLKYDTVNLMIEDSNNAKLMHENSLSSKVFTELQQKLHLFFFDFSDTNYLSGKDKLPFITSNGIADDESIQQYVQTLYDYVLCAIFGGVSDAEYKLIMGKDSFFNTNDLEKESNEFLHQAWGEVVAYVANKTKSHIDNMPAKEKFETYSVISKNQFSFSK